MDGLPRNAPKTTGEAFAYVGRLGKGATIDDLKILALTEAVGKELYDDLASRTELPEVRDILLGNGREELKHAHRVSEAIEILTGEPFPIPPIDENPVFTPLDPMPVTRASLTKLAEGEFGGKALYEGIASSFDDRRAVALLRLNREEEAGHGERLLEAVKLLPAD